MGCYDSCVRCLGAVPYVTLIATLLCYIGVALFCGGAHQGLEHAEALVDTHFSRSQQDHEVLEDFVKYFQYVIYGLASFFFLYGILLLAEGFYTTSAVKQTFGEFRSTQCSRCLSLTFIVVTFVLALIWLVVLVFSVVPLYFLFNMSETCYAVNLLSETSTALNQHNWVCMDPRQYGLLPWKATPGKVCGVSMANICKEPEFYLSYDLFITAFAGAVITLLALILYIVASTYNYAVLRFLGSKGIRC